MTLIFSDSWLVVDKSFLSDSKLSSLPNTLCWTIWNCLFCRSKMGQYYSCHLIQPKNPPHLDEALKSPGKDHLSKAIQIYILSDAWIPLREKLFFTTRALIQNSDVWFKKRMSQVKVKHLFILSRSIKVDPFLNARLNRRTLLADTEQIVLITAIIFNPPASLWTRYCNLSLVGKLS